MDELKLAAEKALATLEEEGSDLAAIARYIGWLEGQLAQKQTISIPFVSPATPFPGVDPHSPYYYKTYPGTEWTSETGVKTTSASVNFDPSKPVDAGFLSGKGNDD